jgi:hypothetical protein
MPRLDRPTHATAVDQGRSTQPPSRGRGPPPSRPTPRSAHLQRRPSDERPRSRDDRVRPVALVSLARVYPDAHPQLDRPRPCLLLQGTLSVDGRRQRIRRHARTRRRSRHHRPRRSSPVTIDRGSNHLVMAYQRFGQTVEPGRAIVNAVVIDWSGREAELRDGREELTPPAGQPSPAPPPPSRTTTGVRANAASRRPSVAVRVRTIV